MTKSVEEMVDAVVSQPFQCNERCFGRLTEVKLIRISLQYNTFLALKYLTLVDMNNCIVFYPKANLK